MTRRDDSSVQTQMRSIDTNWLELEQTICRLEAEMADLEWAHAEAEMSEIQELVWALLDGDLTEPQLQRLEQLLHDDPAARATYLECLQMHCELTFLLTPATATEANPTPPLGVPAHFPTLGPDQPLGA